MEFKVYLTIDIDCEDSDSGCESAQITIDKALDSFFDKVSDDFPYELINLEIK